MPELVDVQQSDRGVATITLRHGKVNALSVQVLNELAEIARELSGPGPRTAGRARAVIVTGGPKIFAAGADIVEFAADTDEATFALAEAPRVREIGGAFLDALNAVAAIPAPTIASISGFALGGGLELALACDVRIASTRARLGLPEILLGIIPGGGGTQRLARLIGPSAAKHLIFTGRQVVAEEALSLGLVNEVVEADDLDTRTVEFAEQLAAGAPNALALAKAAIDGGLETTLADGLRLEQDRFVDVFASPDAVVGVRSFLSSGPGHADFTTID